MKWTALDRRGHAYQQSPARFRDDTMSASTSLTCLRDCRYRCPNLMVCQLAIGQGCVKIAFSCSR